MKYSYTKTYYILCFKVPYLKINILPEVSFYFWEDIKIIAKIIFTYYQT